MKLLYIHQHYEEHKGATRSYELSKHFLAKGAEVVMISGQGDSHTTEEGLVVKATHTAYHQKNVENETDIRIYSLFLCVVLFLEYERKISIKYMQHQRHLRWGLLA